MTTGSTRRLVVIAVSAVVALLLQVTVLPPFSVGVGGFDVVPDLVLAVVVAVALLTDTRTAVLTGVGAGLLLDLAPPADHVAGRWALALLAVGYVVGRLAHDGAGGAGGSAGPDDGQRRIGLPLLLASAAGGAFVGASVFALTGVALADTGAPVSDLIPAVALAVVLDVAAACLVVPVVNRLLHPRPRRRRPGRPGAAGAPLAGRRDERTWMRAG